MPWILAAAMDLESIHRELDLLAMQNLELTQDLVNAKLRMEQNTRDGHFLLAKARYVLSN